MGNNHNSHAWIISDSPLPHILHIIIFNKLEENK